MTTIKSIIFSFTLLSLIGCNNEVSQKNITNSTEYEGFLTAINVDKKIANLKTEIEFWLRKGQDVPNGFTFYQKAADASRELFQLTGNADHLKQVEQNMLKAVDFAPYKSKMNIYNQLSSNAISRHDFQSAKKYCMLALEIDDTNAANKLMYFDALMELGDYTLAADQLRKMDEKSSFDYLVRWSKLMDHKGDLDSAIVTMELAENLAAKSGNKKVWSWALTNLGDMYGHASRISDSYQHYLKALEFNPNELHALKGIAWIAFAHDGDLQEAKDILNHLIAIKPSPDWHLMLAEIADYEGNTTAKAEHLTQFKGLVNEYNSKQMYHKYLALLAAENPVEIEQAEQIAYSEIENRPTPQSYELLAWTYLHKGEIDEAVDIIEQNIVNQTYEPESLYHMGVIYLKAGHNEKGMKLLNEALESSYELGPEVTRQIKKIIG
ncbi:MAG: hypothetical protein RJQ09_18535 [Cyclobacteriaceae bacterium]